MDMRRYCIGGEAGKGDCATDRTGVKIDHQNRRPSARRGNNRHLLGTVQGGGQCDFTCKDDLPSDLAAGVVHRVDIQIKSIGPQGGKLGGRKDRSCGNRPGSRCCSRTAHERDNDRSVHTGRTLMDMGGSRIRREPAEGNRPADSTRVEVDRQRRRTTSGSNGGRHLLIPAQRGDDGDALTARLSQDGDEVQDGCNGAVVAGGAGPTDSAFEIDAVTVGAGDAELPAIASVKIDGICHGKTPCCRMSDTAAGAVMARETTYLCDPSVKGAAMAGSAIFCLNDAGRRLGTGEKGRKIGGDSLNIIRGQVGLAFHERDNGDRACNNGSIGALDTGPYFTQAVIAVADTATHTKKNCTPRSGLHYLYRTGMKAIAADRKGINPSHRMLPRVGIEG